MLRKTYTVLVIGSGGREHALCEKLAESVMVDKIFAAPGNGGTAIHLKVQNVAIAPDDIDGLLAFAKREHIDLTIVGPEAPLSFGIVDRFEADKLLIMGPKKEAAQLESSKAFAKRFMDQYQLPTARWAAFDNPNEAYNYCYTYEWARVIKLDGLAQGKGVYVCDDLEDCKKALSEIFYSEKFCKQDAPAPQVVIEEKLQGYELSLMMLTDGHTVLPMETAQDYKRRYDGHKGPNTGGMGAFSPVLLEADVQKAIQSDVIEPLTQALLTSNLEYKGILYVGLMIDQGKPYILEFNARFGDPETQCLLIRLENDLFLLMEAIAKGQLDQYHLFWHPQAAVCVVLCAPNYPDARLIGPKLNLKPSPMAVRIYHAGTSLDTFGSCQIDGGRILNVVGLAQTHQDARTLVYDEIERQDLDRQLAYRSDIAKDIQPCRPANASY